MNNTPTGDKRARDMYYLYVEEGLSMEEIGERYSVSRSWIFQILDAAGYSVADMREERKRNGFKLRSFKKKAEK